MRRRMDAEHTSGDQSSAWPVEAVNLLPWSSACVDVALACMPAGKVAVAVLVATPFFARAIGTVMEPSRLTPRFPPQQ